MLQTFPRTVLVEAFTGVWCIHCPAESQALYDIEQNTTTSNLSIAELHGCAFASGTGPCDDNYVPEDDSEMVRGSYYHYCGYPDVFFDGQNGTISYPNGTCGASNSLAQVENTYLDLIQNASRVSGNVSIQQDTNFTASAVTDNASVLSAINGTYNFTTYLMEYIGKRNITIGYGPHDIGWVVRASLASRAIGLNSGGTTWVNSSLPLNSSWDRANLSVVSFVQQSATRIIENSNMAPIPNRPFTKFNLTFIESGLSSSSRWSVDLNGTTTNSTGTTIRFVGYRDGTYPFLASAPGYSAVVAGNPGATGVARVLGNQVSIRVTFYPVTYNLTFQARGLPASTFWGVVLANDTQTTTSTNLTFIEANGTYGFLVLPILGFVPSYHEPAVVNGSSTAVVITFQLQTYPIVFVELGLPAGTNWSVSVVNVSRAFNETLSSTSDSITFFLPNGTYQIFFWLPKGYVGNASSTNFTVAGIAASGPVLHASQPGNPPAATTPIPTRSGTSFSAAVWFALGLGAATVLLAGVIWIWRHVRRPPGSNEPGVASYGDSA